MGWHLAAGDENLDAYDLVLRAIPHASAATPEEASQALVLLERAIALEPDYALAHAFAAWCCEQRFVRGDHREDDQLKGVAHARLVLATSSDDATALGLAGFILWMLAHDRTAALDAMNRVMTLMYGAVALAFMGETALAIERAQLALRLSPMDPLRWGALSATAIAHLLDGRYEEAAEFARRTVQLNPGFSSGLAFFRPRGWSRLRLFPWHRRPGSHVPYKSQIELRAAYMPDAAWAVSVHPSSLSRKMGQPPVLTSSNRISTLHRRFTCVRLSQPCLPESSSRRFRNVHHHRF